MCISMDKKWINLCDKYVFLQHETLRCIFFERQRKNIIIIFPTVIFYPILDLKERFSRGLEGAFWWFHWEATMRVDAT